jgi:dihydrofolate reductase
MRTLTYYVATSIDGFIAGPAGEADFFPVEPDLLAHIAEAYPDTMPTHMRAGLGLGDGNDRFDTVVMGLRTYLPALDVGITSPYAHLRQFVVSTSLGPSPDPAVRVVEEDPLGAVRALKQEPGKGIWLAGGGQLAGALLPEIDELIVKTYPVVAGSGTPMFRAPFDGIAFRLVATRCFGGGSTIATYARAEPHHGSAPEPPRS